jgi:hypothetical protein
VKQQFAIKRDNPRRQEVLERAIAFIREVAAGGSDMLLTISDVIRTLDQNAAMWASLHDFVTYVKWPVILRDGTVRNADEWEMKDILTAAFEQETRMSPGLNGGTVLLGVRTSQYGKRKMGEFLTFLHAEGDERGVVWSKKAKDDLEFYTMRRA